MPGLPDLVHSLDTYLAYGGFRSPRRQPSFAWACPQRSEKRWLALDDPQGGHHSGLGDQAHDGHYHVRLKLDPPEVDAALGTFIQIVERDGVAANASMVVDIEPFGGSRGILGG